jgi:nitrite reductase (NADH) small subunit
VNNERWVRIADADRIPVREGRAAIVDGREIAIFNLGDRFVAVDNRCPHQGGPLADGIVANGAIVCPLHAWKITLRSGMVERPTGVAACVRSYPARLEAGVVLVALPADVVSGDAGQAA